ncbi:MAG: glycosyltransferase family 1 protein [Pseudomonadota bacterium]
MRVALFSGNYNNVLDGANLTLNRLTGYLLAHGAQVRVFSPTVANPAFVPTGQVVSLPSIPIPGRGEYRLAYRFGQHTKAALDAFAPNLVHVAAPDITGHAAKRFARAQGLPVVASFHTRFETYLSYYGLSALKTRTTKIATDFYNGCDHVYVPSQSAAEALRQDGVHTPLKRWTRGINAGQFTPALRTDAWRDTVGLARDVPIVLFVGRLVKEKGLDLFIATLRTLQQRGTAFQTLIVGDGPERAALSAALPAAHFAGHLGREDIAKAYANADVFFNPSDTETFGNVTLEAMASGLSCLVSDASGSRDLVVHGENGYLAIARDVDSHASFLSSLLTNAALRARFGAESRRLSLGRSWDAVMAELVGHYRLLVPAAPAVQPVQRVAA